MPRKVLLLLVVTIASMLMAQNPPQTNPPSGHHHEMAPDHEKMAEMHKQHMEAMKADLDKMKASLDAMKANVGKISNADEKARWQSNVDLWTVMVGHMEQMMHDMDTMGPGMMGHGGMHYDHTENPSTPPPDQKKPE